MTCFFCAFLILGLKDKWHEIRERVIYVHFPPISGRKAQKDGRGFVFWGPLRQEFDLLPYKGEDARFKIGHARVDARILNTLAFGPSLSIW